MYDEPYVSYMKEGRVTAKWHNIRKMILELLFCCLICRKCCNCSILLMWMCCNFVSNFEKKEEEDDEDGKRENLLN